MIRLTELARQQVTPILKCGDAVIDATAGNGADTIFLARGVGSRGRVYAFDIQEEALARTASALKKEGLSERVTLIHAGHEQIPEYVQEPIAAVMFNLGYLPGGDRRIVTLPEATVAAVQKALVILRSGGIISLVVYPGHPGGDTERDLLLRYCAGLDPHEYMVMHFLLLNRKNSPPELITIRSQETEFRRQESGEKLEAS